MLPYYNSAVCAFGYTICYWIERRPPGPTAESMRTSSKREEGMDFLAELWRFMRVRKKFWLMPIIIMMIVFGGLVVLTKGSAVAPFMYTLF